MSSNFINYKNIKQNSIEYREYQINIAESSYNKNTLLVLPTGLGKTVIALILISKKIQINNNEKVLFLAPTKPLVLQHTQFFKKNLKIAQDKNIGVTAIKAISKSRWYGDATYNTWYKPLDNQELVNHAVWFTLSQEGVSTYSLPCDVRLWPLVLDAATRYKKLNDEEQKNAVKMARQNGFQPLFPK